MPLKSLTLSILLAFAAATHAADPEEAARAEEATSKIRDAKDYLRDMRDTVELAKRGEYGKLKSQEREQLDASYRRMKELLDGHASPLELSLADRIDLFNAQESIVAIVDRHPKDTMICRRQKSTGTRIPSTECLTIAQREARALGAREAADRLPKRMCDREQLNC